MAAFMALLFLSHSGIDTAGARALKARILAAAPAGIEVWFDKDSLHPGKMWQPQIEDAIARSSAFAVYVGTNGVLNWVDAEVRLALARAIAEPAYRFVPIFAASAPGPSALPGFARQFQGLPEDDVDRLVAMLLDGADAPPALETQPFFGLSAIDEERSHLFFGRERETDELLERVVRLPLVLVSGDSGSGKSSLVRAGLVPMFRGGAAAPKGQPPPEAIWHVVVTRPRSNPWRELGDAVERAARQCRRSEADCALFAREAESQDPTKARRALRCGLDAEHTRTLVVVDQFEELFTATPEELREPFVTFLLGLADPRDARFRVVLAMRHDYVNLCNSIEALRIRLNADGRTARFVLNRMTDEGLERIVTEPLRLAGETVASRQLIAKAVLQEVGSRPGDLALVQVALTEMWRIRGQYGGDLAQAYIAAGRVEGALAKVANDQRTAILSASLGGASTEELDSVLVRLVRIGDSGGTTRRQASRDEFDDVRWQLIQRLAGRDGGRLLILGGSELQPTVELAHEALVTAWSHFQNLLQSASRDKRVLDVLIDKTKAWTATPDRARESHLATGAELAWFAALAAARPVWLSSDEKKFVDASERRAAADRRKDQWLRWGSMTAAVVLAVSLGAVWWQYRKTQEALSLADSNLAVSILNRLDSADTGEMSSDEIQGLWELAHASPAVRSAFVSAVARDRAHVLRFANNPATIGRALRLHRSSALRDVIQEALLRILPDAGQDRDSIAAAIHAVGGDLNDRQRAALAAIPPQPAPVTRRSNPRDLLAEFQRNLNGLANRHFLLDADLAKVVAESPGHRAAVAAQIGSAVQAALDSPSSYQSNGNLSLLADVIRLWAPHLSVDEAQPWLTKAVGALSAESDVLRAFSLASVVRAVSPGLQVGNAEVILKPVLDRARSTRDADLLAGLAFALKALPDSLPADRVELALAAALKFAATDELQKGDPRDDGIFESTWRLSALANQLTPTQARQALDRLFKNAPVVLANVAPSLAFAVQELLPRLDANGRAEAARICRSLLGWHGDPAWAEAFLGAISSYDTADAVRAIVEVLQYPTVTDSAADILLDALQSRGGAPGKAAGFHENMAWVARTHPALDLDAPPACPVPLWPGASCPTPAR